MSNLKKILKTNRLIWVCKDNAYGFGIDAMLDLAKRVQIHFFAVKSIEEGIFIRKKEPESQILILGKRSPSEMSELQKYQLIPTINDEADFNLFQAYDIPSHVAIDTGMNRFGIKNKFLELLYADCVQEIYTHIADEKRCDSAIHTIEKLSELCHKECHIGGSIAYGKTSKQLRIGKLIYDGATYFYGHIVNIKLVKKGESVGYDGMYTAPKDELVGVCDIGYVDGLNLYYHGFVSIRNNKYQCIGRCCMDQCFILIDSDVKIGDEVEFFGCVIDEKEFIKENGMTLYELYLAMGHQKTIYL